MRFTCPCPAACACTTVMTLCFLRLQAAPAAPPPPHPRRSCTALQELRLNHNQLQALPSDLAANTRLRILDCGGNAIQSFDDVQVRGRW